MAEIDSASFKSVNSKIDEIVGGPGEQSRSNPYVTIAQVKKGEGKKYLGDASLAGREIQISHIEVTDRNNRTHEVVLKGAKKCGPVQTGERGSGQCLAYPGRKIILSQKMPLRQSPHRLYLAPMQRGPGKVKKEEARPAGGTGHRSWTIISWDTSTPSIYTP